MVGCGDDTSTNVDPNTADAATTSDAAECTAGATRCDGLVPETCSSAGRWEQGQACAIACVDGACADGVCEPGTKQCDGLVPQNCDAAGGWQSAPACAYVCSAGECTGACVPDTKQCDGLVPQTCDAAGGWQGVDACPYVCSAGECTGACVPSTKQCNGLVPQTCDVAGAWQSADACPYVCSAGECTGVCVPDAVDCSGLVPRRCDATGNWQSADACPYVCSAGACTGVCVPGDHRCADGATVETCDAAGQWQRSACLQVCSAKTNQCACASGYDGDGATCTPIDFCSAPNGGCSPNATCSQNGIVPACACNGGREGDGLVCYPTPSAVLNEGFDDITKLAEAGWLDANRSSPVGSTTWFQGNHVAMGGPFNAHDGNTDAYIGANFNNTGNTGTINTWLATPSVTFGAGSSISFYTRSPNGQTRYADRVEVRVCTEAPCALPPDTGVGSYTTLLGSVNPSLAANGYPADWTKFTFTNANGIPYLGTGRIAIRYYVTSAGLIGGNSDYIGIDRLVVNGGVPAYSVGGTVSGLTKSGLVLWLNGIEQRPIAADGSFSFTRALDTGTRYSVRVYQQPAGETCVVTNAHGTIASANVGNVQVTCSPD
ncbi:MAG: hypothetical protein BGO98_32305 [Myxococcales bacterium 68-20]|nr:MAG: hypothetical protein BGO98_32305 [Myxococcales bacterium 68-20]